MSYREANEEQQEEISKNLPTIEEAEAIEQPKKAQRNKSIKLLFGLCLVAHIIIFVCVCPLISKKSEKHLYDWLEENGQLLNGTDLEYKQTGEVGDLFVLRYSTVSAGMMYIEYSTHYEGYHITVELPLFYKDDGVLTRIEVENEDFLYRGLEYYHNRKEFTRNSPIEHHDWYGNTEAYGMTSICEDFAQKSICKILDWMSESLCPSVKMELSDFGYTKYK